MRAELTRVVYTIKKFDRASADNSTDMNQKTRWERRQGKEGELLQIKKKNKQITYRRGKHTGNLFPNIFSIFSSCSMNVTC